MRATQTKLALAPTVGRISFGPRASSVSSPSADCRTRPSVASPVGTPSAPNASAEILRAADVLRSVLLWDDDEENQEQILVGQVSAEVSQIVDRLQSLAGLQMMFEGWNS